jgi:phosphate transport system protein
MRHFFEELSSLETQLVDMAGLVKSAVHKSVSCLIERNADHADQVIRYEAMVNQAETAIDELAIRLVCLNQPVASDMRLVIASLKINGDLERMGGLAMNIARRALTLIGAPPLEPAAPISSISDRVENMVERCITAFNARDDEMALGVIATDDEVDRIRNEIREDLCSRMEHDPSIVRQAVEYMAIASNLERIADHAANIAQDVVFVVKGVTVRHRMLP